MEESVAFFYLFFFFFYHFKNLYAATFIIFVPKAIQLEMCILYTNTYIKLWVLNPKHKSVLIFFLVCQPDIWLKHVADLNLIYADLN